MLASDVMADVREILGKCSDDLIFRRITDAISVLAGKGDWTPMLGYVDICTTSDCRSLTLPNDVETPLAVNVGGAPKMFRNKWHEFHINGLGSFQESVSHWDDAGYFPVIMDIVTHGILIAVADSKNDVNSTIRVYGDDSAGFPLRMQNEDGEWENGVTIPVNLFSDFPLSSPVPDPDRIFRRKFVADTLDTFVSTAAHQLTTGAEVTLTLVTPPLPTELTDGGTYFVRAETATTVKLYTTRENALADSSAITLSTASAVTEFLLSDRRGVGTLTQFESGTNHNITLGMAVSFTAGTLPNPLVTGVDYYGRPVDLTHFTVHNSLVDATANVNPIDVESVGAAVVARAKQALAPNTFCSFSTRHNFLTGDLVVAQNTTGVLPQPLVSGASYYIRVLDAYSIALHASLTDALSGENTIILTTPGTGSSQLVKTIPCTVALGATSNCTAINHNLTLTGGDFIQFTTDGVFPNPLAQGTVYRAEPPASVDTFTINDLTPAAVTLTTLGAGQLYLVLSRVFTVNFLDTWNTNAELVTTGDAVKLESTLTLPATNPAVSPLTTYYARKLSDTSISLFTTSAYAIDTAVRTTAQRSRAANVATITTSANHGLVNGDYVDISGVALTVDGVLTTVTVTGGGGGYTDADGATLTEAGGQTARGTLTVAAGVITAITVTDGGTGFTPGNALTITADSGGAAATANVNTITDGVDNDPNSYNGERLQVTVTGLTTFTYASTGLDEPTTADVSGQIVISSIKVNALGTGTLRLVFERSVTPVLFNNYLRLSDSSYLADGVTGQFETTGTLPAPLAVLTNYVLRFTADPTFAQVYTTGGVLVTLTTIGDGLHNFVFSPQFSPELGINFEVVNNEYETGDMLTVNTTGTTPPPLVAGTAYYARRLDADTIELYDTEAHALNLLSTVGRIEPTGPGVGTQYLDQILSNWDVSKITDVVKDATNSVIHLYVWDYGRADNLTVLGHYNPNETQPRYRRIKIGSACSWVRIRYKRKTFTVSAASDFIPLTNKMALIFMVKALELLRNTFSDEGQKYEKQAIQYLEDEQSRTDGPDTFSVRINGDVWGPSDYGDIVT